MITLTDWEISTLKCAGRAGKTFRDACKEIRHDHHDVREAVRRQGLEWEMKQCFKKMQADPENGMRGYERINVDDLHREPVEVPDNPQARWLTQSWRAA